MPPFNFPHHGIHCAYSQLQKRTRHIHGHTTLEDVFGQDAPANFASRNCPPTSNRFRSTSSRDGADLFLLHSPFEQQSLLSVPSARSTSYASNVYLDHMRFHSSINSERNKMCWGKARNIIHTIFDPMFSIGAQQRSPLPGAKEHTLLPAYRHNESIGTQFDAPSASSSSLPPHAWHRIRTSALLRTPGAVSQPHAPATPYKTCPTTVCVCLLNVLQTRWRGSRHKTEEQ